MKYKVYLGFEDDFIEDKYEALLDYTINKIGGKPNWIDKRQRPTPLCKLCGLALPLIVQIYAPLEKSQYHRTLYLFACINPNCWNKKESWVCLRSQVLDRTKPKTEEVEKLGNNFEWCDDANVWGNEENINVMEAAQLENTFFNVDDISSRISLLNCNKVSPSEARGEVPAATAEIEGDEGAVVAVETPLAAQVDLAALMDQVKRIPQVPPETLEFVSCFISVAEEDQSKAPDNCLPSLPQSMESHLEGFNGEDEFTANSNESMEGYEKTLPSHGDKMFHRFISTIQKSPGQILRYIRDGGDPMFLYPAENLPTHCQHCKGGLVVEFQLLPTLVSSLQLVGSGSGHIEFGTVLVFACKNSCWTDQAITRSEHVFVQQEL